MRTLLLSSALAGLITFGTGCATDQVVVIDSRNDVVRIGPDVVGSVYIWQNGQWVLAKKVKIPQGWYAGPMPAN